MNNQNLIDQLNKIAYVDNSWQDDVLLYEQNQEWLDYSAKIAVLILRVLRQNKNEDKFPSSQKELAEVMNVSPQQISKFVRGTENLKLETIMRISQAIGNQLINVGTVNNIYSQTTKTIVTNIVTNILPSCKFITSSNNGGFMNQNAFKIEEKNQSDSNAVGNTQYAMAA